MKFQVGDKVRIIKNQSFHNFKIGEVVLIDKVEAPTSYSAKGKNNRYWHITDSEVEKINKKTNKIKSMKPKLNEKVVKKVKELQEKPKISPLKEFDDYTIKRERGKIAFGCGEVTLTKQRMLKYAEIIANRPLVNKLSGVQEKIDEYKETIKDNFNYPNSYSELSLKELKNWVALLEDKELMKSLEFLKELSKDTGNRYTVEELLELSHNTILRIIG